MEISLKILSEKTLAAYLGPAPDNDSFELKLVPGQNITINYEVEGNYLAITCSGVTGFLPRAVVVAKALEQIMPSNRDELTALGLIGSNLPPEIGTILENSLQQAIANKTS